MTNKPQINQMHPRISKRTPEHQKYRDDLAKTLQATRNFGTVGKMLAENDFSKEVHHPEYILAKYGYTKLGFMKLIESGNLESVKDNIDKFECLDKEIALTLIKAGIGQMVLRHFEEFEGLDKEVALNLIESGRGWFTAKNVNQFEGVDDKDIACKLIEKGHGAYVVDYLSQFEGLNHKEIACKLIEAGHGKLVISNIRKFNNIDKEVIALMLRFGLEEDVRNNITNFPNITS